MIAYAHEEAIDDLDGAWAIVSLSTSSKQLMFTGWMLMRYEQILYEVKNEVTVITLNRPEVLNAWTTQMDREIGDPLERSSARAMEVLSDTIITRKVVEELMVNLEVVMTEEHVFE